MDWKYVIAIVVTVVLSVITIIQGFRLVRKKRPSWAYVTRRVIGLGSNAPPELKLTFGDVAVNEVFRTTLIFFNRGREPIRAKDDVVEPISIIIKDAQILREPIIHPNEKLNKIGFVAKRNGDCIEIDFKCLDYNDGAVIEILHTKSAEPELYQGKILGAPKIEDIGKFEYSSLWRIEKLFGILFIPCVLTLITIIILYFIIPNPDQWNKTTWFSMLLTILATFLGLGTAAFFKLLRLRKFPSWSRKP